MRVKICFLLLFSVPQLMAQQNNTDAKTGLIIDQGFETVKTECTVCHSAKLIIQNRATRQGWLETIRWMQNTQGLRQLPAETEREILTYLATNYPLKQQGRRANPVVEKWYWLNRDQ
ncbi:hypothetical protein [Methylobacter sp. YRD-M1]|uniref:hypothetical protein n=1 Tax=Methylobacter sp. YRD-M1 TaxID=2911520 RepID=UPI00227B399C|nr:hypothetical protein [Methylobacter sp. YRD-M1]WAK03529.1 hypothetical protein LZ558_07045 [Methylobacter sp. YRD-M1]